MKMIRNICLIISFLITGLSYAAPTRITLLLPLHGNYAESSQAIRDGFITAYYQSLSQDASPPTIRIINTSNADIVTLYRQAIDQGANVIVGPLSKDDGLQLVQAGPLSVPTLILNNLPLTQNVSNLYQLSLSPEDEVIQVAAKARKAGRKNAAIIVPSSPWGQRVAQVFLTQWQAQGGKVIGEMFYESPEKLAGQIAQLMHVDESEKRVKLLQQQLHTKIRSFPYRRQDVDMVFLVAKPEIARELRPLLDFYYADKIPVYATSHLYAGSLNPQLDKDLNGVLFCAIPWEIAPQTLSPGLQAIWDNAQKFWPQTMRIQPQFFALGVDSYRLARQMLTGVTITEVEGVTGHLTLQANKIWYRQLPWAEMVEGQPQLLDDK